MNGLDPLICLTVSLALGLATTADAGRAGAAEPAPPKSVRVYVGTYTNAGSRGVYRFDLDPATGATSGLTLAAVSDSPSFLALDPSHKFLYAANEVDTFQGKHGGGVSAFSIDPKTGELSTLNQQSSVGTGPCHLVVDSLGKSLLVANYGGGGTTVLPILDGGKLGPASVYVKHHGSSVDKGRQGEPHAHSVNLDAANHFALVADLGLDKVLVYRFNPEKSTITPDDPPSSQLAPGSGPRHLAFSPSGKYAYVISELNSTVTAFAYDARNGTLAELQTVTTLPGDFHGKSYPADVHVHPNGRFLYGSNRGHDSIAVFAIVPATGKLTPAGHQGAGIKNPRNFGIDPTGKYLLVANQDADTILVFRIDESTGALTPTGQPVRVSRPVCLQFVAVSGE